MQQTGTLVVISGPSGVGKGTLVQALLERQPQLHLSVSATTRAARAGETDGVDYYFWTRDRFEAAIAAGEFLEHAEYAGNYYGTPQGPIAEKLNGGQAVLLEIELVGARAVRQVFPTALSIFLLPPSLEVLETRLRERGTDDNAAIGRRLERARAEIAAQDEFDLQIVNDDLETALQVLEAAIFRDTDEKRARISSERSDT
ncbi:MAG: guanylate kinase [Cyanobacteria bacterium J06641_5]